MRRETSKEENPIFPNPIPIPIPIPIQTGQWRERSNEYAKDVQESN